MLLWLDFETTGLSPIHNRLLEVGWTLTNDDLGPIHTPEDEVQSVLITPSQETWAQLEEFNSHFDMHLKNGLYDDLLQGEGTVQLEDAEDMILADIEKSGGDHFIIAGSGVHFDKAFIEFWMPRLAAKLHYRLFDMSTIKRFLKTVGIEDVISTETHRAAQDVVEALRNARLWQRLLNDALDAYAFGTALRQGRSL